MSEVTKQKSASTILQVITVLGIIALIIPSTLSTNPVYINSICILLGINFINRSRDAKNKKDYLFLMIGGIFICILAIVLMLIRL